MIQHTVPLRTNLVIFSTLVVLLMVTIGAAYTDLGPLNTVVAIAIAVCKALLIMLYFMHLRFSNRLTWVFAGAAFLWLGILIALSMSDFLTRGWLSIPGK
ncbi:MAG TPA: cytochrome C oxidase subunit IV family protein [Isosphaeraceae bacterium]|jgi:cytochrome c oxidase subunit 4|nr:cytochrome C oxidase subunit IV family protein [Isosphaeraceae bacterium]